LTNRRERRECPERVLRFDWRGAGQAVYRKLAADSSVTRKSLSGKTKGKRRRQLLSTLIFRPVRPEDDTRSASDDRQVTKRSAEAVPSEPRGLRGRGGERPLSKCQSERSSAHLRERDSEMTSGELRRGNPSRLFSWRSPRQELCGLATVARFRVPIGVDRVAATQTKAPQRKLSKNNLTHLAMSAAQDQIGFFLSRSALVGVSRFCGDVEGCSVVYRSEWVFRPC